MIDIDQTPAERKTDEYTPSAQTITSKKWCHLQKMRFQALNTYFHENEIS